MAQTGLRVVFGVMKTIYALNFFLVGLTMCFCPAFLPNYFSDELEGGTTSELWLLIMGAAQMVMGVWTMGLNEVPRLLHSLAEWEPVALNFRLPEVSCVLTGSFYDSLNEEEEVSVAISMQRQLRLRHA